MRNAWEGHVRGSVKAVICLLMMLLSLPAAARATQQKRSMLVRTTVTKELTYGDIVGRGIDVIARYRDGRIDLAVTEEELGWLESKHAPISVLERAEEADLLVLDRNLGEYHTYDEMRAELEQLSLQYPDLTVLDTIGTSIEGRHLLSLKISDNADLNEEEPEVLIMGCHHARELMSVEVPLHTARYLLEHYGIDSDVTDLVDGREIWIVPMVNPDGHAYVQENHKDAWYLWWRKNRRNNGDGTFGVDLNRNYSYMWGYDNIGSSPITSSETYRGAASFSEPETQAMRDFCAGRSFVLTLSYHSYGEMILFPWGYIYDPCDHEELFTALGDSINSALDYLLGAESDLNLLNGSSEDWCYGDTETKPRSYSFAVELNTYEEGGFAPPESSILPTCERLLDLNLTLIRLAEDPRRVMFPDPPRMYAVEPLDPPDYRLAWSGGETGDMNGAVSWDLVEFKNIASVFDSCEGADFRWKLDGFAASGARAAAGLQSFYSGSKSNLMSTMQMDIVYPAFLGDTLRCWLWYDIEEYFDWAYLDASFDQGRSWITVPGNRTTDENPFRNRGHGITGSSGGWVDAVFYLDMVGMKEGDVVLLRFSYFTDESVVREGIYIDQIAPVSCSESHGFLAWEHPDTFFVVTPSGPGVYHCAARGVDIDGQRGLWSNVVVHTVSELAPAVLPGDATALAQNYPNPFNPTTTIAFCVGKDEAADSPGARVLLELYDVSGRRVAVFVDERRSSGRYSVAWDGRNERGEFLASGVYFARLAVGNEVRTRKLVLLR